MASYTQITRNEAGEYIRETKNSSPKTFYLVAYATHATYFKVEADTYEEACDNMYDDGIVTGSVTNYSSGDFVRVLGHCVDSGNTNGSASIYFNPDNTWIEIA